MCAFKRLAAIQKWLEAQFLEDIKFTTTVNGSLYTYGEKAGSLIEIIMQLENTHLTIRLRLQEGPTFTFFA